MEPVSDSAPAGAAGDFSPSSAPSAERWLQAFRRAVEAQRRIFDEHSGIEERTVYDGVGEGGDNALVIDRLCEDAVFAELEAVHAEGAEFRVVSEERGEVSFGKGDAGPLLVIDPIDGSLNARRTIPCFSLSIAVSEGDSMEDVTLGYVYEFGAGEEFVAGRGSGATLDGEPLAVPTDDGLEVVAMEATRPDRVIAASGELVDKAFRIRASGSLAVSLAYVGAARFDALISTRVCRSVDVAAGQLIVREAGGVVNFGDGELSDAPLDLDARYHVAAARTAADLETVRRAQAAVP
jgi:myo-inositol-1(or 4)-monophosphatase